MATSFSVVRFGLGFLVCSVTPLAFAVSGSFAPGGMAEASPAVVRSAQNPYAPNHSFYYPPYFSGGYYDMQTRSVPVYAGRFLTGGPQYYGGHVSDGAVGAPLGGPLGGLPTQRTGADPGPQ